MGRRGALETARSNWCPAAKSKASESVGSLSDEQVHERDSSFYWTRRAKWRRRLILESNQAKVSRAADLSDAGLELALPPLSRNLQVAHDAIELQTSGVVSRSRDQLKQSADNRIGQREDADSGTRPISSQLAFQRQQEDGQGEANERVAESSRGLEDRSIGLANKVKVR